MYPWPSFGAFTFQRDEMPLFGTDVGWILQPAYSRKRTLGSASDTVVVTSLGSRERSFECYLEPDRFRQLELLVSTQASFTDWNRPLPDERQAFLTLVEPVGNVAMVCTDGVTRRKIRTRVAMISARQGPAFPI